MAKVLIVFADGKTAMLVLPATYRVHLEEAAAALGVKEVHLAGDWEFAAFADCEGGAMPPFGKVYDLPVWVDRRWPKTRRSCSGPAPIRTR